MPNQHSPVDWSDDTLASEFAQEDITATAAGVACSVTKMITAFSSDGGGALDNLTLADAAVCTFKIFIFKVRANAADTVDLTPAHMIGGTKITFDTAGQGCSMVFHGGYWLVFANNGGTIS